MQGRIAPSLKSASAEASEFCHGCNSSTKHTGPHGKRSCMRCGKTKNVHSSMAGTRKEFIERLNFALGINEEADTPKPYKNEGEAKTSQTGAHRPDKGVKFTQIRVDDQFKHKGNYDQLKA